MACKPNSPTWQFLPKMPSSSRNTIHKPFFQTSSRKKKLTTRPVTMKLQTAAEASGGGFPFLKMKILDGCEIYISNYWIGYDGQGGEGTAQATSNGDESGVIPISFDMETLHIPPLTSNTANVFGLGFPPFVTVRIEPDLFQGCIAPESGQVRLGATYVGEYKHSPLLLDTLLALEESIGAISGRLRGGERLGRDEKCRLVGVATIHPVHGDPTMNSLLDLPTECVTDLRAAFSFY